MREGQRKSRQQERRTARLYGGRVQPGSGNGWSRKGDVRSPEMLIENKYRGGRQITVRWVDLRKITHEAEAEGRIPVFGIELAGDHYVILPEADFLEFLGDRTGTPGVGGER